MSEKVLVALGGNAILQTGEKGTADEQSAHVRQCAKHLAEIVAEGSRIAITHGNGPQVGDMLIKEEMAKGVLPPMPLDICGAQTQGMIGYMLQRSMDIECRTHGLKQPVVTVVSQVVVEGDDPAFADPVKFVGPYYTGMQASRLRAEKEWTIKKDGEKGYRRVVPSPEPVSIVEGPLIKSLFDQGAIVVACGGGGISVTEDENGELQGVEAVIDKDHTAALLAREIGADVLLILTDIPNVAVDFDKPSRRAIDTLSASEARSLLAEGQFPPGSMGPKVESAVRFVEAGGKRSLITSLELGRRALSGDAGTTIVA